jgi:hypothetical protein
MFVAGEEAEISPSVLLAQNRDSDPNRDWIVYTYELNY